MTDISLLPPDIRALYPFKHHWFETGVGRIQYVDVGQGRPVVMLHGNPTWSFYYRNLIKELAPDFRCIAPDHLGCGLSDKPQEFSYRLRHRIAHVRALIDSLGIQQYDLVAHDWGGAVAMGIATLEPDRVRRIVLMNTGAFLSKDIPGSIALCRTPVLGEILVRGFNAFAWPATFMAVKKKLPPAVRHGYLWPYNNWKNRVAVARFVQDIPMEKAHPSYEELERIDKGLQLLRYKPLMLPWGGADFCFTPKFFEEFRRRFPESEPLMVPDAGHYLLEDAGDTVIPAIRKFLER